MKLILTGAKGNLGRHIRKNTESEIFPVSRADWVTLDKIKADQYQAIIHCAYDLKNNLHSSFESVLDSNVMTSAKALRICKEKGIPKFIFISSCSVYGNSTNTDEDSHCSPITMNGFIKLFNEELIKSYCIKNNINFLILRAFNSYGGFDSFSVVQKIIDCAKNNKNFTLYNDGISERDFIHINDLAKIVCMLYEMDIQNEIINIGSGSSVKIIEILRHVELKFGKFEVKKSYNDSEILYSRANLTKINNLIDYRYINLLEYISDL